MNTSGVDGVWGEDHQHNMCEVTGGVTSPEHSYSPHSTSYSTTGDGAAPSMRRSTACGARIISTVCVKSLPSTAIEHNNKITRPTPTRTQQSGAARP